MALADFVTVPHTSLLASAVRTVSDKLAAARIARRQKQVLDDLLFMPEHRLRDLGIDPRQIVATLDEQHWPTRK